MVRALLSGQKTQTRRVAKTIASLPDGTGLTCLRKPGTDECLHLLNEQWCWRPYGGAPDQPYPRIEEYSPFGRPGDWLWVKETFKWYLSCGAEEEEIRYRADGECCPKDGMRVGRWKPAIFMRRTESRISLEITGVRLERLNTISEGDAIEEGIEIPADHDYVAAYKRLWESINGAESWAANPWVWVIEFGGLAP